MSLLKGAMVVGGAIVGGATACAALPVITVASTPSLAAWLIGSTTTYTVNGAALAGATCAATAGAGVGRIAGQTGGALVIQGLDDMSQKVVDKMRSKDPA